MDDKEKIIMFADMVNAAEKLNQPLVDENERLHKQLEEERKDRKEERIATLRFFLLAFLVLGIVFFSFIWFAYLAPDTTYQAQEFEGHQQVQSSGTEVVTNGG